MLSQGPIKLTIVIIHSILIIVMIILKVMIVIAVIIVITDARQVRAAILEIQSGSASLENGGL